MWQAASLDKSGREDRSEDCGLTGEPRWLMRPKIPFQRFYLLLHFLEWGCLLLRTCPVTCCTNCAFLGYCWGSFVCRKETDQELVVPKPRFWHKKQYKVFFACEKKVLSLFSSKKLRTSCQIQTKGNFSKLESIFYCLTVLPCNFSLELLNILWQMNILGLKWCENEYTYSSVFMF